MMLHTLAQWDTEKKGEYRYEFVNWYFDEPNEPEAKARLSVVAGGLDLERISG
jgi:hypothetical protein